MRRLIARIRNFATGHHGDERLREEMGQHLAMQTEENIRTGMAPEEARRQARLQFGAVETIRERYRAEESLQIIEALLRDMRISGRTLLRSPGFSIIAILVMALCIGATTSLFTVMRSVLLRPLPFRDPDQLVMIYEHFRDPSKNAQQFNYNSVAPADFYDWRAQTHGFEDMAVWRWWQYNLTGQHGELPELVSARAGSWNLFPLLGVQAAIGRTFTENEDRADGAAVMLTWNIFERRFGGDASIVGKQIHLDGKPYTVIGVLPRWFTYPDAKVQIWVPYASGMSPELLGYHDHHFSYVVARLRPEVSLANALSQVGAVQYRSHMRYLNDPVAEDVVSRTLSKDLAKDVTKPLVVLLGAVACMLLIGCLNVANLLVARSAARQKEISIRSALGAQRVTLIRAQLMESLLISIAGGAAGVMLSLAATRWLVNTWKDLPSAQGIHVDAVVMIFACGLVFAAALLAGLLPAISSTGKRAIAALQASARSGTGSQARTALRKSLLTIEIAATVVLLISAGLLLKSFWRLRTTDVGCVTENVLTISYNLPAKKYETPEKANAFNEGLLERVRNLPGIRAAGLGFLVPGAGPMGDDAFTIREHPAIPPGQELPVALYARADPDFFTTLQIPLLNGRFFTKDDRAGHPETVIVSRQLAQQYLPGENPLGKHLHVGAVGGDANYEIVGVVADTLYQVGKPSEATIYFPALGGNPLGGMLVVRTASDPLAFSVLVQKQIAALDPEMPVRDVFTLQQIIERSLGNASLSASLVLAFAVLSLMLASVGLYGVLSYLTTQRTGEIGIRIALGAQRDQVMRLMLGDGMRPALYGLALGLAASAGAVRLVQSMLYETQPLDPAIFTGVATTLLAVAALACMIPAWRASRIDPMQALRSE